MGDQTAENDEISEHLWAAIAAVRDASPRLPNDADTWDIVAAVMAVLRTATVTGGRCLKQGRGAEWDALSDVGIDPWEMGEGRD